MHREKFIHRDIKPANILLVKMSENFILYKLGDPGIGKNIDSIGP